MRNLNTSRMLEIAHDFMARLQEAAPGCRVELGGSLASNTVLPGHQDIDLKVLVPAGQDDEAGIRAVSAAIANVVAFQKVRPYGGEGEQEAFAIVHQKQVLDSHAGEIEVEVLVVPERVYVGYAKFQAQLPAWMLDAYVAAKWAALQSGNKAAYKAVKAEFYAITRALYKAGYFKQE